MLPREERRALGQAVKRRAPGNPAASLQMALWDLAANWGFEIEGQGDDAAVSGDWKRASWWGSVRQQLEESGVGHQELAELCRLEERVYWAGKRRGKQSRLGGKRWCIGFQAGAPGSTQRPGRRGCG